MNSAAERLDQGVEILRGFLARHGFQFAPGPAGKGSGGLFSSGSFVRGNRRLELHFRFSLGLVTYHVGERSLSHEEFIRAQPRLRGLNQYPGYSDDPIDGFRHLLADLEQCGQVFLAAPDSAFASLADWVMENPRPTGWKALGR